MKRIDITRQDYILAKKAFESAIKGQADIARVICSVFLGNRDDWKTIVDVWEYVCSVAIVAGHRPESIDRIIYELGDDTVITILRDEPMALGLN